MTAVLVGDIYALAGGAQELVRWFRALQQHARSAPGCLGYTFAEDTGDPGHYVLTQEWRDEAAFEAHHASALVARYQHEATPLLARPSEIRLHRVAQTLRLVDDGPLDPRRAD